MFSLYSHGILGVVFTTPVGYSVQGVLTLFCRGAAQVVCHALRVVELSGQLEAGEEDGDRQEEEEEEKGEVESRRCAHDYDRG